MFQSFAYVHGSERGTINHTTLVSAVKKALEDNYFRYGDGDKGITFVRCVADNTTAKVGNGRFRDLVERNQPKTDERRTETVITDDIVSGVANSLTWRRPAEQG